MSGMKEVFEKLDSDGDGKISKEDLASVMETLGYTLTKEQLDKTIADIDLDGDNRISYAEFSALMEEDQTREVRSAEMRLAFQLYDTDRSGKIDKEELYRALRSCGKDVTRRQVKSIMRKADWNNDGELDFEEFCGLFAPKAR